MNTHKNARLTYVRRIDGHDVTRRGMSAPQAARTHGVSAPTARKWLGRYLAGAASLRSRARLLATCGVAAHDRSLEGTGHRRVATQASDAGAHRSGSEPVQEHRRSSTARAGLSLLSGLLPAEPVVRYAHEAPGDMIHIDTRKLGRIERPSHRVTRQPQGLGQLCGFTKP